MKGGDSVFLNDDEAVVNISSDRYLEKIVFTIEEENNGQISFLDTLVSRKNGVAVIDVYRKPTHTDRYLDFSSHHEIKHKVSAASTLLFRAANLPSTHEGKLRETSHVTEALTANGYPSTVIPNILKKKSAPTTPPPEELVSMFFKWADPSDTSLGSHVFPTSADCLNLLPDYFAKMTFVL